MSNEPEKTPTGRVPGAPLTPRHEKVAHALIRGATNHAAGVMAGFKDTPYLKGNISRLRQTPEMVERLAELAAIADEDARTEDHQVLADFKLFRQASPAWFWKRDDRGRLILRGGKPQIDFSRATEEQLRCIKEYSVEKGGRVKLTVHDPMNALDRLAKHKGLLKDRVELTGAGGGPVTVSWKSSPPDTPTPA